MEVGLFHNPQKNRGKENEPPPDTQRKFFSLALVVKTFVHLISPQLWIFKIQAYVDGGHYTCDLHSRQGLLGGWVFPNEQLGPQKKEPALMWGRLLGDHRKLTWFSLCLRLVLFPSVVQRVRCHCSRVECPSRWRLYQESRFQSGLPHSSARLSPPL